MKKLIIFLLVLGVLIAGMTYYHYVTPNPYDAEVFFGSDL